MPRRRNPPPAESSSGGSAAGITWRENHEKDGVEIIFGARPDDAVLARLKAAGWRWSRFAGCWYTRRTERALQFAREIAGELAAV